MPETRFRGIADKEIQAAEAIRYFSHTTNTAWFDLTANE